jgi:hypothetical protein
MAAKAYDLKVATAVLNDVAAQLAKQSWFSKSSWICSVHNFPPPPAMAESVTLRVYKQGWFNHDHQGIHFETFISPKEWRSTTVPLMMHILHTSHIPNTDLKRIKLSQPFIDKIFDKISSWPGYVFRAGKYGTHPFTRNIEFALDDTDAFISSMAKELTLLCKELGPIMDKTLAEVAPQ